MNFRVFRDLFWVLALLLAAGLLGLLAHTAVLLAHDPGNPNAATPAWRMALLADGEAELARRAMLACGLLLTPLFLWGIGGTKASHGWRPWKGYTLRRSWWHLLLVGTVFGALLTATVVLTGRIFLPETGAGDAVPGWSAAEWLRRIATAVAAAFIASIWLVTLIDGAAFRSALKAWGLWPAVAAVALLFGFAHHLMWGLDGTLPVADEAGLWSATFDRFGWWANAPLQGGLWLRILNAVLLGGMIALIVLRTGTIWLAAGCLSAWWGIGDLLAQAERRPVWEPILLPPQMPQWHESGNWLWGLSPNRMDGLFCLLILAAMVAVLGQSIRSVLLRSRSPGYVP